MSVPAPEPTVVPSKVGQAHVLALPENPSTGYDWAVATVDHKQLKLGRATYVPPAPSGGDDPGLPLVGVPGTREFHVVAQQAGTAHLELKLWRAWEGDSSVVERRRFVFEIRP